MASCFEKNKLVDRHFRLKLERKRVDISRKSEVLSLERKDATRKRRKDETTSCEKTKNATRKGKIMKPAT